MNEWVVAMGQDLASTSKQGCFGNLASPKAPWDLPAPDAWSSGSW